MSTFYITGIAPADAAHLFTLSDAALAELGALRTQADAKPGFPCRVSLADAEPGEELILFHFKHHAVNTPYQAGGPVFVRKNAVPARLAPGEVPLHLLHRTLSLRGYTRDGMMAQAQVVKGEVLKATLEQLFDNARVAYVHIHNAAYGCFLCKAERA